MVVATLKSFLKDVNWEKVALVFTRCDLEELDDEFATDWMNQLNTLNENKEKDGILMQYI